MLDRLAQLESELGKVTPEQGNDEGGPKKKTEDGEEVEDEPIEEDEDDFQDDDDYYQVICARHVSSTPAVWALQMASCWFEVVLESGGAVATSIMQMPTLWC